MNEHLARFFEQADTLLAEWKAYGDSLRTSLDAQARALEQTVAQAIERAGREAAGALSAHMEETLRASLEKLRHDVDTMSQRLRVAGQSSRARTDTGPVAGAPGQSHAVAVAHEAPPRSRTWQSGVVLLGLTLANVILAALLVSSFRSCRGQVYEHRPGSGWGTPPADQVQSPRDAAATPPDAAAVSEDAGAPVLDAGVADTKGSGAGPAEKSGTSGEQGAKSEKSGDQKTGKKRGTKGAGP